LSRPPPGFGPLPPPKASDQSIQLKEIDVPYYNLPASLMLKFIKVNIFISLKSIY